MAPRGLTGSERAEFERLLRRLRELQRARGWSLRQLSKWCGLPHSTLARWLRGEGEPDPLRLEGLKARLYRRLVRELARDRELLEELLSELQRIEEDRQRRR